MRPALQPSFLKETRIWQNASARQAHSAVLLLQITHEILLTGSASFIGSALALRLLERGDTVIGVDNHNTYYCPALKEARLQCFAGAPELHAFTYRPGRPPGH
jgi:hypothetical protein